MRYCEQQWELHIGASTTIVPDIAVYTRELNKPVYMHSKDGYQQEAERFLRPSRPHPQRGISSRIYTLHKIFSRALAFSPLLLMRCALPLLLSTGHPLGWFLMHPEQVSVYGLGPYPRILPFVKSPTSCPSGCHFSVVYG